DSLALKLSELFPENSRRDFKKLLSDGRRKGDAYVVLKRNVSYTQLEQIKKFPILKRGARGGLVTLQTNKREHPYKMLAQRTIGYPAYNGVKGVGIEAAYDSILTGVGGKRLMQKMSAGTWRAINEENEIDPKDGAELYTTIDVRVQNVAENALMQQLIKNKASHGCVVLMEVKTGEIRAIVNLKRKDSTTYVENYNFAVGDATEPGSTFKLASLLAVMDDGYADLDDNFNVGNGKCYYYGKEMPDSHAPESPVLTMQRIFETSSNVGVSKIITKYYSSNPQKFLDHLYSYNLNKKLGMSIPGEGMPLIRKAGGTGWSGLSLPWISIGYESLITPMHTLTLYNAVANNGCMVKPMFVKEIKRNGITQKKFNPEILNEQIAKPATIAKARKMCEGVVLQGTGKTLANQSFTVAGKTGTAQMANNGSYGVPGAHIYQSSFVGYFPADKPLYTCIVIINAPSNGIYYGGAVSGPVFKEIAEKVYSTSVDFQTEINTGNKILTKVPSIIRGNGQEMNYVINKLNLPNKVAEIEDEYFNYVYDPKSDSTKLNLVSVYPEKQLQNGVIPNLSGMSVRDALYILENHGLSVEINGFGKIKNQSLAAGTKFTKGTKIILQLG
ncbi:MAG: transpeptidase family protein, partial [Bacteroidia bacterium]|nr:transpeptidase family protein [Bacteroidia bacterium]